MIADPTGGELAQYLISLYHKVIKQCLLKHSKRPSSEQVSQCMSIAFMIDCSESFVR